MIEVEQMVIKVPGMKTEDARWIAEDVAARIADMIPEDLESGNLDDLNIKTTLSAGAGKEQIAARIALEILQQLKFI